MALHPVGGCGLLQGSPPHTKKVEQHLERGHLSLYFGLPRFSRVTSDARSSFWAVQALSLRVIFFVRIFAGLYIALWKGHVLLLCLCCADISLWRSHGCSSFEWLKRRFQEESCNCLPCSWLCLLVDSHNAPPTANEISGAPLHSFHNSTTQGSLYVQPNNITPRQLISNCQRADVSPKGHQRAHVGDPPNGGMDPGPFGFLVVHQAEMRSLETPENSVRGAQTLCSWTNSLVISIPTSFVNVLTARGQSRSGIQQMATIPLPAPRKLGARLAKLFPNTASSCMRGGGGGKPRWVVSVPTKPLELVDWKFDGTVPVDVGKGMTSYQRGGSAPSTFNCTCETTSDMMLVTPRRGHVTLSRGFAYRNWSGNMALGGESLVCSLVCSCLRSPVIEKHTFSTSARREIRPGHSA